MFDEEEEAEEEEVVEVYAARSIVSKGQLPLLPLFGFPFVLFMLPEIDARVKQKLLHKNFLIRIPPSPCRFN